MYICRNTETRSPNNCCRKKARSVIHSKIVFVASGIRHEVGMRRIAICGLSGCTIFFYIVS